MYYILDFNTCKIKQDFFYISFLFADLFSF